MKKKFKRTKTNSTFSLPPELIVRLAEAAKASGLSISKIVEQGITDRLKTIPLDCPTCGTGLIDGRCPSPSKH